MHWTQSDPAGGGYSYADDDPINNTDLSGLCSIAHGVIPTSERADPPNARFYSGALAAEWSCKQSITHVGIKIFPTSIFGSLAGRPYMHAGGTEHCGGPTHSCEAIAPIAFSQYNPACNSGNAVRIKATVHISYTNSRGRRIHTKRHITVAHFRTHTCDEG
jgi:hypothetical protein